MNKEEFLKWLYDQQQDYQSCWQKVYTNSDDHWQYYQPWIDGMQPWITLIDDFHLKYENSCNGILNAPYEKVYSYDEFIEAVKKREV